MAMDSIIASPTNRVRVMVAAASGCCASELNAVATARPWPSAGPMLPTAIVRPAVTMEAIAMSVMLSTGSPIGVACGGSDVNRGQNAEYVGLNHAGEQAEHTHRDRENKG